MKRATPAFSNKAANTRMCRVTRSGPRCPVALEDSCGVRSAPSHVALVQVESGLGAET